MAAPNKPVRPAVVYQEDEELVGAPLGIVSTQAASTQAASTQAASPVVPETNAPSPSPSPSPSPAPAFNVTPEQIKDTLTKSNIASAISQLQGDPSQAGKLMAEAKAAMPPNMMEAARKMAMGSQGGKIAKEMQKQGVDKQQLLLQMKDQKKAAAQARAAMQGPTKKVVVLNHSRKLVQREVAIKDVASSLKCDNAVQMLYSRMAVGPLTGKAIKVWYNPDDASTNRRATNILGTRVGGDVIFENSDGDLLLKDVEATIPLL